MPHPDPILARDRRRKEARRAAAYLRSLERYHPLQRGRPAWVEARLDEISGPLL